MNALKIDPVLEEFLQIIQSDNNSIAECTRSSSRALSVIAEKIRLGRAVLHFNSPSSAIRPQVQNETLVLYEYDGETCCQVQEIAYTLPDRGSCTIGITARGKEPFSDDEFRYAQYFVREIFLQFSRFNMQNLLQRVLLTDLDTDAATLTDFMQYAASLLRQNILKNYTVIFFNIHNFKYVNKVFSYSEGDTVLRHYTHLLMEHLFSDEKIARLGGDNYVVLVRDEHTGEFLNFIQNIRLRHKTADKMKNFVFGATVGYSDLDDITTPREVMSRASIAYQSARQTGAGSVSKYSDNLRQQLMANQEIISSFRSALENKEFLVYYQPKVDVKTEQICGAEALVRWMRNGKLVPPNHFVPILEQEGSICILDFYVLEQVCIFLRKRIDQGLDPLCISVNFSRRHLEDDDMIEKALEIIDRYSIDHKLIEIELTESNDYQNYQKIRSIVNTLHQYDVSTSMDDFGTGFSSLNLIKEADLNVIKIDKSLIPLDTEYANKETDLILFENLIRLVKQLGKKPVAEGVETSTQLKYISKAGCNIVQGYLFDKPLTEEDFIERLSTGYENVG